MVKSVSNNSALFDELKSTTYSLEEALNITTENFENRFSIVLIQQNQTMLLVQNITENIENLMVQLNKTRTKVNNQEILLNNTMIQQEYIEKMLNNTITKLNNLELDLVNFKEKENELVTFVNSSASATSNILSMFNNTLREQANAIQTLEAKILTLETAVNNTAV